MYATYSAEARIESDRVHTDEDLAEFKTDALDMNFENDPGFGYYGDLDGQVFATFPFSLDATHEDDPYWRAAWLTLLRDLKEAETGERPEDDDLEEDTDAIKIESYKLWVGSIRVKTVRFDTENEKVLRRALSLYENMESRGDPYGLADEDEVSEQEFKLCEEAYNDDWNEMPEYIEQFVRERHFGFLYRNHLTPRKFTENYGQRLAFDAMQYNGEWGYIDESSLEGAWSDIEYEIEHGYI